MKYTVWDVETSTKGSYKRKANPFDAENYVVANGYKFGTLAEPAKLGVLAEGDYFPTEDNYISEGDYFPSKDNYTSEHEHAADVCKAVQRDSDWFTKLLPKGTKLLVGQNIKFDLLYAIANPNSNPQNLTAWMDYVAKGGLVWDIQLAEYLLAAMEPQYHMLSLDEIAPTYGGNVKLDEVKALWEAGVDTIDINEDLLMRYLLGRKGEDGFEEGDIGNTELVFRKQWQRAIESGQLKSILLNMGSLIFTTEAERNGMFVNKELGLQLADELAKKLAEATLQLEAFLPEGLPFDFNWNSRFHKSALIFGGTVNYKAPVMITEDGKQVYAQKKETHALLADGSTLELDSYLKLALEGKAPEAVRFAGGSRKGEVKTKQVTVDDLDKPKSRIEDLQYTFDGFTAPVPEWEGKDKETGKGTGVYSLDADNMATLTENTDVPFLKTLGQVVKMTKDLGTYFITTDEKGNEKGMLTLVQLDSIIHHMLNHTSTVTARFSSSNPNLQNIPKGQNSRVKEVFQSRFGEDGIIIQSDFSSLEVYVQAILTRAKQLIEDLKAKMDMHVVRLAAKEGKSYDEVLELCKPKDKSKEGTPEHKEWDYKRTKAKIFSFQRAYGAGVKKISASTGMPEEDVQALADAEDARYPEIGEYFTNKAVEIQKNRIPTGDMREHPEIKGLMVQLGKGYSSTPDGKRYSYREYPAPKYIIERKGGKRATFMPTEIKNYEVQGGGGEWAKAAAYLSIRGFYSLKNFDGLALLVNQVHDAEYADAHKKVAIKAAALLHVSMEEASTFMEWWFKWPLPLPVPSDTTWGTSMAEEKSFTHPGFQKSVDVFRPWVRKQFIGNYTPSWDKE